MNKTNYLEADWNEYARVFAAVQTSVQRELQNEAVKYLHGDVGDFGCGTAKIGALLSEKNSATSYKGIDASEIMIEKADWLLSHFKNQGFSTFVGLIEDYHGKPFDSAVSLNSFYTWHDPKYVLSHIFSCLKENADFVIATPNPELDLHKLDALERRDLITHPDYESFRRFNLMLVEDRNANFVSLTQLVSLLMEVGFKIKACHKEFYLGGLNFCVASKPKLV